MTDIQNLLKFSSPNQNSLWNSLIKSLEKKPSSYVQNNFEDFELDGDLDFVRMPSMDNSKLPSVICIEEQQSLFNETIKQEQVVTNSCFEQNKLGNFINFEQLKKKQHSMTNHSQISYASSLDQNMGNIFTRKELKGKWRKNTNVPKFLARIFMKHFSHYSKQYGFSEKLQDFHKSVSDKLSKRGSNNYSIADVLTLLGNQLNATSELRSRNQQIMAFIIRETLEEEVIGNKYIKDHHKSYMLALKVYTLRCRSKVLTERVKIF